MSEIFTILVAMPEGAHHLRTGKLAISICYLHWYGNCIKDFASAGIEIDCGLLIMALIIRSSIYMENYSLFYAYFSCNCLMFIL